MRAMTVLCLLGVSIGLQAAEPPPAKLKRGVVVFRLANLSPDKAASKLELLFPRQQRKGTAVRPQSDLTLIPDATTKTLLVVCKPEFVKTIGEIVHEMDWETPEKERGAFQGYWGPPPIEPDVSQIDLAGYADRWIQQPPSMRGEELRIVKSLEDRGSWTFDNTSLHSALGQIAGKYDLNVVLDKNGLRDAGATPKVQVTHRAVNAPLGAALKDLLAQQKLGFKVADEVVLVTSLRRLNEDFTLRIHPVADLAAVVKEGRAVVDFASLVKRIQIECEPQSWKSKGGKGEILLLEERLSLAVRQTESGHRALKAFLDDNRKERAKEYRTPPPASSTQSHGATGK